MARLGRQVRAQILKNLLIHSKRHWATTSFRAFLLPVIYVAFISYSRYLFVRPAEYGIGTPEPVKSLNDVFAGSGRQMVFVNNGLGGDVDSLIQDMRVELEGIGEVKVLEDPIMLQKECKQSLRGVSKCFAAVVFEDSPGRGEGSRWNYTLRADSAFGMGNINAEEHDNDVQKYLLPVQSFVDKGIARRTNPDAPAIQVDEYMYTSMTKEEYEDWLRTRYSAAIINYVSVALLIGMIGIVYHLTGWMATERERGLSTLVEAMGGSKTSRMISYHLSFSIIYIIGWVIISLNLWGGIFKNSSIPIVILWHILTGFSLASWSLFCGTIFKKAQLSGISVTVFSLGLGIIAQVLKDAGTGAYAVLSLLFPPMNYVFFSIGLGRAESQEVGINFVKAPPAGNSKLPPVAFFIFLIVQIVAFPILGALIENYLYGTKSPGHRHVNSSSIDVNNAVELRGFTKRYPPRLLTKLFGKHKEDVVAVDNLDLSALRGQILVLLGANGSGKTTTLEAVAGLANVKEGNISVNTGEQAGGIGICPQKNVLWDDLTVAEHVKIWNRIKCADAPDGVLAMETLLESCDLMIKKDALSKNLSGGQKRKLQLAAMFTGGSTICAIDEVSSGLDPLSRRKIWDIILAARGSRTIMMTSHYLDEADLLADHIAILSKGKLKCEGSAVELKTLLGGGYRVHAPKDAPEFDGIPVRKFYDQTVYNIPDSSAASRLVDALEKAEISNYYVAGPTIEDVFLKVAEESTATRSENVGEKLLTPTETADQISTNTPSVEKGVDLYDGSHVGIWKQTWYLIRKRLTIFQRGYLPTIAAIVIPIVAAGITMVVFKDWEGVSCSAARQIEIADVESFGFSMDYDVAAGPQSAFTLETIQNLTDLLIPSGFQGPIRDYMLQDITNALHIVNSVDEFNNYISANYANVKPGGFFLEADKAVMAFLGDDISVYGALSLQNIVNNLMLRVPSGIASQYLQFDFIWPKSQGTILIWVVYCGLAFGAFPAFFALYPTVERLRNVRALHYSNGVRAGPLWLAYTLFDFAAVILLSAICIIIFSAVSSGWYGLGYLFVVFVLFGLASILQAYIISLIAKSQLSAFAFVAGGQDVMFLIYFIVYMSILTYAEPGETDKMVDSAHYVIAAFTPMASLIRALFVAVNSFSIDCNDEILEPYPGAIHLYGGPILYLVVQSILFFAFLVAHDSGWLEFTLPSFRKAKPATRDEEDIIFDEKEIADELARVSQSDDGLRILHLSKSFKKNLTAVDDVSFGVPRGDVFALLGPNGAGKTTTINMIRGDMAPSSGTITVQSIDVVSSRSTARQHLGVCPQFDAMDRMSVTEHLEFYARIRGVTNIEHNVTSVIRAVGLEEFRFRPAEKLSGGNKRKLSLAIALMGNPAVLLLDEPSSGMDAASKRVMWRTLEAVSPGRSVVLTTHSMEECSALATRAGILAKRMLALGSTEELRRKYGDRYLVHLVLASAPFSTDAEMDALKTWVREAFPNAEIENISFGGQVRFSIPNTHDGGGVAKVFRVLEKEGRAKGAAFWSVDRGTMDMVFLEVVGRARVKEEGYEESPRKKFWKNVAVWVFAPWMKLLK